MLEWWASIWNSVDLLGRINIYVKYAMGVFVVLTAIGTFLTLFVSSRIDALKSEIEARLNERLQTAETTLESTRRELEETRRRQQPRTLTPEQRGQLVKALRSGPRGPVDTISVLGDAESHAFAIELDTLLKEAGWVTGGVSQAVFSGNPTGLIIKVHSKETVPPHAVPLQRALNSIGVSVAAEADSKIPAQSLALVIGRRP